MNQMIFLLISVFVFCGGRTFADPVGDATEHSTETPAEATPQNPEPPTVAVENPIKNREPAKAVDDEEKKHKCEEISMSFAAQVMADESVNPVSKAFEACEARKGKAVREFKSKVEELEKKIEEGGDGIQEACSDLKALYKETSDSFQGAVIDSDKKDGEKKSDEKSCETHYSKCEESIVSFSAQFESKLAESGIDNRCDGAKNVDRMLQKSKKSCALDMKGQAKKLKKDLDDIKVAGHTLAKCDKATRASGEPGGGEKDENNKKSVAKSAGQDGGGKEKSGESPKKTSNNLLSGMPSMPSPESDSSPSSPAPVAPAPQASDATQDGCYAPGGDSKPGCACVLTGNCRNADATPGEMLGATPGLGGAKLTKENPTGPSGTVGLSLPGMNAEQNSGSGFTGGNGDNSGGGGGFGGGGGGSGAKVAAGKSAAKPRSPLAADILSGTRGSTGRGSNVSRTHPGFSSSDFSTGSREPASVDVSQFTPDDSREALLKAIPAGASDHQEEQSGVLRPANADLFEGVHPRYQNARPTLLEDEHP